MYKIVYKRALNPYVTLMDIEAPLVARKAEAGQFIILRTDDEGERIPLTVAATIALSEDFNADIRYCSNRKEIKDHGDKGILGVGLGHLLGRILQTHNLCSNFSDIWLWHSKYVAINVIKSLCNISCQFQVLHLVNPNRNHI